jgi:hypothetical protein
LANWLLTNCANSTLLYRVRLGFRPQHDPQVRLENYRQTMDMTSLPRTSGGSHLSAGISTDLLAERATKWIPLKAVREIAAVSTQSRAARDHGALRSRQLLLESDSVG